MTVVLGCNVNPSLNQTPAVTQNYRMDHSSLFKGCSLHRGNFKTILVHVFIEFPFVLLDDQNSS